MTQPTNGTATKPTTTEPNRTPLLAALGAGDLAAKAVVDAVHKAKERAESTRHAAAELPSDLSGLREKLDPSELRKLIDNYADSAVKLYQKLADQGEGRLDKFKANPQVKKVVEQLEEAIEAAQTRIGDASGDARSLAEDILARVTRRTRSVGEKTAIATKKVAAEIAETVEETGDEVASDVRSVSRRVANKTAPTRKPAVRKATPTAPKPTE
jgi:heparin binding hemagglutinin HbhA